MGLRTGAEVLVDCLRAQGVTTAFGVPGESYLAVLDALIGSGIRMVANRHEGGAAFMAEAWGKLTGEPGVCFVTRGPGATNASIGVHTAMQDSTPMVLFIGQIETGGRDRELFQEVDYRAFFGPIAKWATEIDRADRVPEILARAFAVARSGRPGPVVVALPEDMLAAATAAGAGPPVRVPMAAPAAEDIAELRDLLAQARRPLVLAGGGGWGAAGRAGLRAFAEANALPVATVWRYTDLLDNASPSFVGTAGLGKTASVRELMLGADLILALGIRFGEITTDNYALYPPPRMTARLVHAHASDGELNKIYTADLAVHAHPDRLLPALAALRVDAGAWAERTEAARAAWLAELETPPQPGAVDMGAVTRRLAEVLPDDAILTNGAGNFSIWPNKHFPFTGGRRLLAPQSGAMGYGLPAAIAAKIARPEATVVCYAGDGDFQMTEAELATAAQASAPIVVLLVNNGGYGTIRMHQERHYPGRVSFTELANPDFAAMARSFGMLGERVERTGDFPAALARALASPTGAVLDLAVDIEALTPRASLSAIRDAALKESKA
ncbi:MAG: thiamine pyrophosphate-binding protein [Rhodovulum sulfidophilum]|uniref:Thiamine pyrophosphate-binding protein n=1 Tax=Rhodovulum sulfidophilum TaxID=35806 RepID=A0A2W5NG39_RHOSU|nr:MAG: thiamine pyrophosphate-binding protein [Rhodovulum sulfidophilum]